MARFKNGYVKCWRSMWDGDLADNPILFALWNGLLSMATWQPTKIVWEGRQRELPAGSVVFGIRELAERWRVSSRTIFKWVHYLHDTKRLTLETGTRGSIATICNWKEYQVDEEIGETRSKREVNAEETPGKREVNLIEEVKKVRRKEDKNKYIVHRKRRTVSVQSHFDLEAAYQKYPLKVGKTPGLTRLAPQIKTEEDYQMLLAAITRYRESDRVKRGYILNFNTFVSQWRDWADPTTGTVSDPNKEFEEAYAKEQAIIDADYQRQFQELNRARLY